MRPYFSPQVLPLLPSHATPESCVFYTFSSQGSVEMLVPSPEMLFPVYPFCVNTCSLAS